MQVIQSKKRITAFLKWMEYQSANHRVEEPVDEKEVEEEVVYGNYNEKLIMECFATDFVEDTLDCLLGGLVQKALPAFTDLWTDVANNITNSIGSSMKLLTQDVVAVGLDLTDPNHHIGRLYAVSSPDQDSPVQVSAVCYPPGVALDGSLQIMLAQTTYRVRVQKQTVPDHYDPWADTNPFEVESFKIPMVLGECERKYASIKLTGVPPDTTVLQIRRYQGSEFVLVIKHATDRLCYLCTLDCANTKYLPVSRIEGMEGEWLSVLQLLGPDHMREVPFSECRQRTLDVVPAQLAACGIRGLASILGTEKCAKLGNTELVSESKRLLVFDIRNDDDEEDEEMDSEYSEL